MTEDVNAGRLYLDAYVETRGVTRGMQARLDAEMKRSNIRAKIKASIDSRGSVGEARRAAAEISRAAAAANVRVKFKAVIDTRSLIQDVRRAAAEASREKIEVKVKAAVDQGSVGAARAAVDAVGQDQTSTVHVDADTARARAEIEALGGDQRVGVDVELEGNRDVLAEAARLRAEVNRVLGTVEIETKVKEPAGGGPDLSGLKSAGTALTEISRIPMLAGGFYALGTAIVNVGGGLVAMASSASTAAGALAVIPNLIGVAGQGLAALLVGFSGVGEAVKQMTAVDNAAAVTGQASAQARVDAARRIKDAQRGLGDAIRASAQQARDAAEAIDDARWSLARSGEAVAQARESLADAHRAAAQASADAMRRIREAERNVVASHQATADAQRNLTQARVDARKEIDRMNEALRLSRLDEQSAMDALTKAREDLQDVQWNAAASPQERRDAEMAVRDAENNLERIRSGNKQLAADVAEANKKGVEGSDQVVSAKKAVNDAQRSEKDAVREVSAARRDAARTQVDNARSIRDAEYGVRDALHAQQEAREALADAERAQAQGAKDAQRAIADAQRAVADAQRAATAVADDQTAAQLKLQSAMNNLSPAGQRFARFLKDVLMPRLKEFKFAVQEALLPGVQLGIQRAMPLLDTLQRGIVKSARIIGGWAARLGTLFGSKTFNTDVAAIMRVNNRALAIFLGTIRNLIVVFTKVAKVAGPVLLVPLAKWTRALTAGWAATLKTERGQKRLHDWLVKVRGRVVMLKNILWNLVKALGGVGKAANPTGDSLLKTFENTTREWAKWANSDLGQKRMKQFFKAVEPTTKAVGRLVGNLTEMLIKLGEGGASPLVAFVDTLDAIVSGINRLLDLPGVGKVIGWVFMLAGVGGALGMVSGIFLRMAANLGRLGGVLSFAAQALGLVVKGVWLLGRALVVAMGPWGTAIVLVVGLFILLYKKVDWFRKGVDWFVGKVVDSFWGIVHAAEALWDKLFGHSVFPDIMKGLAGFWKVVKRIMGFVGDAFKWVGKVAKWLWDKAIKPAWKAIQKGIEVLWKYYYKPILKALWSALKTLGGWASWLWKKAIKPAWEAIQKGIEAAWKRVLKPVLKAVWSAMKEVGGWAKWLWNKAIKPAWDSIRDKIDAVWDFIKPIFDRLTKAVKTTIPDAFRAGVKAIKGFWNDLQEIAAKPVRFIVNTVYTKGIKKVIDAIPGVSNLPDLKFARGGVLPGYTPGRDVHRFVSPTAGNLALSGGEGIAIPQVVRTVGKAGWDALNAAGRRGKDAVLNTMGTLAARGRQRGFSRGGVYDGVDKSMRFFLGGVLPLSGGSYTSHGSSYPYPAYDLNYPGYADYGKPIRAWKAGVAHPFDYGSDTSYGRGQQISHGGGVTTLYAHMSRVITSLAGKMVRAGQTIGYVGDYGNTGSPPTSHLHFEVRGAPANLPGPGEGGGGGVLSGLWDKAKGLVSGLKDQLGGWVTTLQGQGGWGPMLSGMVKHAVGAAKDYASSKVKSGLSAIKDAIGSVIPGGDSSVRETVQQLAAQRGWGRGSEWSALSNIISRESGWNPNADNPSSTAAGLFQKMTSVHGPIESTVAGQTKWGLNYIRERYGDPIKAWAYWQAHGNYDAGGLLRPGTTVVNNATGKDEVVFTNDNMVDLGESLRATAATLKSLIRESTTGAAGGLPALVENLTLMGRPEDMPNLLADANLELRRIRRGGVHAKRSAGAPA